jgi:hypothetical protein
VQVVVRVDRRRREAVLRAQPRDEDAELLQ